MKCLKQVLRCACSDKPQILLKWEWYMWAKTRKTRLKIVRTTSRKFGGKGSPKVWGKILGSSSCSSQLLVSESHQPSLTAPGLSG